MARQLQISIPTPCHEDWDQMTPVDKGKFCGSCQKQVVDFSLMSDRQIAEFFKKPSTGSVCGRFMTDQLEREIEIPRKRIPWLKYFFQIVIPTFLFSLKSSSSKAQGEIKTVTLSSDTTRNPVCEPMVGTVSRIESDERGERGYVRDAQTGKALAAASVTMFSTIGEEKISVRNDGAFVLNIYRKITVKKIVLSCEGYEKKEITLDQFLRYENGKHIVDLQKIETLDEVVVVARPPLVNSTNLNLVGQKTCSIPELIACMPYCCHPPLKKELTILEIRDLSIPSVKPVQQGLTGRVGYVDIWYDRMRTIKGMVMDETGEPLPGTSIRIKGSMTGVSADMNGRFEIKARTGDVLAASGANLERTEATIGAGKTISITVKRLVLGGTEVVVTAGMVDYSYTRTRKKDKKEAIPVVKDTIDTQRVKKGRIMIRKADPIPVSQVTAVPDASTPSTLKVFPNPVENGSGVKIDVKKIKEGFYTLQLIDMAGQPIHQQQVWIDAKARILDVDLPIATAGTYFIILSNRSTGKKFTEKIIIQ